MFLVLCFFLWFPSRIITYWFVRTEQAPSLCVCSFHQSSTPIASRYCRLTVQLGVSRHSQRLDPEPRKAGCPYQAFGTLHGSASPPQCMRSGPSTEVQEMHGSLCVVQGHKPKMNYQKQEQYIQTHLGYNVPRPPPMKASQNDKPFG